MANSYLSTIEPHSLNAGKFILRCSFLGFIPPFIGTEKECKEVRPTFENGIKSHILRGLAACTGLDCQGFEVVPQFDCVRPIAVLGADGVSFEIDFTERTIYKYTGGLYSNPVQIWEM